MGVLLDGASETDVAETLGVEHRDVRHAVHRIPNELRLGIPTADVVPEPVLGRSRGARELLGD